ncbi:MAG TPA: protein translocase subunit SecF [Actinomycetota bacterium]|nr:protein translocase subunit SecF [Actinomycetota bacterium]
MTLRHAFRVFRGYEAPNLPFVQRRRWWFYVSAALIAISVIGLLWRGLNFSIDFTGGTQILFENPAGATVEDVRSVLGQSPYDRGNAEIQLVAGNQVSIRTSALTDLTAEQRAQLIEELAAQGGIASDQVSTQVVGPTWGAEISRQAVIGLIIALIAITLYITLRFEWKMAAAGMVALVHDLIVTTGVYVLTGREVSPAAIIAILTILGYSLYDTVVIFDKIEENVSSPAVMAKQTYEQAANVSLNQVMMRSVNTSIVSILPISSLLLFGGETLKDFAFAMLVGVMVGTYSSIFVAAPILVVLKEREPRYRQARARLEGRVGARRLQPIPEPNEAEAVPETTDEGEPSARPTPVGASASRRPSNQRPRPKSRRRPPAKRKRR